MSKEGDIPTEADAKHDRELLALARRTPIHFGFGLAAKAEDDALVLHKRLAPKMLAKQAKAAARATKVVCGTLSIEDKLLTLACETAPMGGLSKRIRLVCRRLGLTAGIRVIDPDGNMAEEAQPPDEQDEEQAEEQAGSDGTTPDSPMPDNLVPDGAAVAELRKAVMDLANAHKARLTKDLALRSGAMLTSADAARDAGRFDDAVSLLRVLKQELDRAFGIAQTATPIADDEAGESETEESQADDHDDHGGETAPPDRRPFAAARKRLVELGERMLVQLTQDERAAMSAALKKADLQAEAGDVEGALALITGLIEELETPAPATKLMPFWRETREALDKQIAALRKELRKYDHPDLRRIADHGFNAFTGGRSTRLMAALFDHQARPDEKSAKAVVQAIAAYRELLSSGSVLDDYDNNPFGIPISFRKTLTRGLDGLTAMMQGRASF